MFFSKLKALFKKNIGRNFSVAIFLALGIIIFVTGYWHLGSLGIYGDDWGASTYVFQPNITRAVSDWWRAGAGEVANFRLLDSVLPVFWYGVFQLFGLKGIIVFNFLCFFVLSWLFYLILKQHVSWITAFLAAVIFSLYPTNNAYLWQVTLSYTLSLICVFSAVLLFYKQRLGWTLFFLLAAIFINEGTFFIFSLALLFPGTQKISEFKPILIKWLKIVIPLTLIYGFTRIGLEMVGLTGGNRAVSILHNFNLASYIFQFFKAEAVVLLISWALAAWKLYYYFNVNYIFIGVLAAVISFFGLLQIQKNSIEQKSFTRPLLLILAGLILICAGRYYGFYYVPSINSLNLDCRYYFAASVGGAVVFAGLFEFLLKKYTRARLALFIVAALLVGYLVSFRIAVQNDYAVAWNESKKIWKELLLVLPHVPENSFLYVEIPGKKLGKPVTEFEAVGDLRVTLGLLGRNDILAVTSPFVTNLSLSGTEACVTSPPFYSNRCFPKDKAMGLVWRDRKFDNLFGAFSLDVRGLVVPESFYKVIGLK